MKSKRRDYALLLMKMQTGLTPCQNHGTAAPRRLWLTAGAYPSQNPTNQWPVHRQSMPLVTSEAHNRGVNHAIMQTGKGVVYLQAAYQRLSAPQSRPGGIGGAKRMVNAQKRIKLGFLISPWKGKHGMTIADE
jgi:hypothetical protein